MPSKLAALTLAAAMAVTGTFAFAQGVVITPDPALAALTPEQMVERRQETMQSNRATMGEAAGLTGAPAVAAADQMIANFSNLTVLFPEGSIIGETRALPVIWERNADFEAILARGVEAATAMKAAAEAGDAAGYTTAVETIGGLCGECHGQFRS